MARFTSRGVIRPLVYTSILAATGGVAFYTIRTYRSPVNDRLNNKPHLSQIPPRFPKLKSRDEQIADLKRSGGGITGAVQRIQNGDKQQDGDDGEYDLLIIGGGSVGSGIALDAVTRGLKVALVEREDFSSGTSSKSTKLVHGGVRYLEKAVWNLDYNQYKLVKEALSERKFFLDNAPHLSSWLPTMLPVRKWWEAPYLWAGTKLYDFLAGSEGGLESSYFLGRKKAISTFPTLDGDKFVGALVYYDGQHNDSRMNVSLATTAALCGATVVNHMEVTSLEKGADGKICGAQLQDRVSVKNDEAQKPITVRAKGVINATGPFSDAIQKMDEPTQRDIVAPSSGVHIVLPGYLGPKNFGLIDPSSDGRVIFLLPWEGNLIAGTTDNMCKLEREPQAEEKDIEWILSEVRRHLAPEVELRRSDVLAAWSGIRPLVYDPNSKNTESLVRNHLVTVSPAGLLTCAGGKWTTYREMAQDAVTKAVETFDLKTSKPRAMADISGTGQTDDERNLDGSCQTHRLRLVGAHGYHKTLFIDLIKKFGLEPDVAQHLARSYGDRAWEVAALSASSLPPSASPDSLSSSSLAHDRLSPSYPYLKSEILYSIRNEYAQTASDFLARRTRLAFLDVHAALSALPAVIDTMGEELKWSEKRKKDEWKGTVGFLASMGLERGMLGVTREEVVEGNVKVPGKVGGGALVSSPGAGEVEHPQPAAPGGILEVNMGHP